MGGGEPQPTLPNGPARLIGPFASGALWNLASNAINYGSATAPVLIRVERVGEQGAAVSVHNEGPPIAPEQLERLFTPYARGGRADGPRGWGLGLTLVRGCARAHGGRVSVHSDAASGTTFRLELPLDARPAVAGETP